LYFPRGTYIYGGTGLVNNPSASVTCHITIVGDGKSSTQINFTTVTNGECIYLGTQASVGSGRNDGSGLRDVTIIAPAGKRVVKIVNLERWLIDNVYLFGGTDSLTIEECRNGTVRNSQLVSWTANGIVIIGESYPSNFFTDLNLSGSATGSGILYSKTTGTGADGVYMTRVGVGGVLGGPAFNFTASTAQLLFISLIGCVADGTFGTAAFAFTNVEAIILNEPWAVTHGTNAAGILLDNVADCGIIGGDLYASTGTAADLRLRNSVVRCSVVGTRMTGTVLAIDVDATNHGIDLRGCAHSAPTFCNDFTRIVPAKRVETAPYFANAAALHDTVAISGVAQVIASGTYTPVPVGVTNIDSSSASVCQWLRVGNVVHVSGQAAADTNAAAASVLGVPLPVASNLAAQRQCTGTGSVANGANTMVQIYGDPTNDRAEFSWLATTTDNRQIFFTFTYLVA